MLSVLKGKVICLQDIFALHALFDKTFVSPDTTQKIQSYSLGQLAEDVKGLPA